MRRVVGAPRPTLDKIIEASGFSFAEDEDGTPYWDESVYYAFTIEEIETGLEDPTNEISALCVELVETALANEEIFAKLCLPLRLQDIARESWKRGDHTLYGRFDFSFDGVGPAKLLEYNADTPTSLFETAVFQWNWLEDGIASGLLPPDADQFNSVHDRLIAQWGAIASGRVHLAALDNLEDRATVQYLAQTAEAAGLTAIVSNLSDIGDAGGRFVDEFGRPIDTLFKLYPWEWMIEDDFARSPSMRATRFIEPAWKAILSTKAILPLLWEMAPNHPNLLPARFTNDRYGPDLHGSFVRKFLRSREGANVTVVERGCVTEQTGGMYGGPSIDQALAMLPDFDGNRPVVGSWVIGDTSCGIGIRESAAAITTNSARFIPHVIQG